MKPGYKSTEFWGKIILQAAALANLFLPEETQIVSDPVAVAAFVTFLESVYIAFRSLVKAKQPV